MNKNLLFSLMIVLVVGMLVIPMLDAAPASATDLADAIAATPQGMGKGQIDSKADPGYLGIPGGPKVNILYGLLLAIWVGYGRIRPQLPFFKGASRIFGELHMESARMKSWREILPSPPKRA